MTGSLYVNSTDGDAQLVINKDGTADDEIRLCILNHDESETAYIVVDRKELRRILANEELDA